MISISMTRFGRWSNVKAGVTRLLVFNSTLLKAFCFNKVVTSAQTLFSRFFLMLSSV